MIILGINFMFHDSSACILKDGKLVVAVEEERFTRNKHDVVFPRLSIEKCLEIANLSIDDIDHIGLSFKPTLDIQRKIAFILKHPSLLLKNFNLHLLRYYWRYRTIKQWYNTTFINSKKPKLHFIPHHQSHIAGSFFASPYNEAALLSMDGSGEWATASLGYGNGIDVTEFKRVFYPNSMGSIYEAITYYCGFKPSYDEGKTMGLAPLGNSERFISVVRQIIDVGPEGDLLIDFDYFTFDDGQFDYLSNKFIQKFGPRRLSGQKFEPHHMDVAAAFQLRLEEVALKLCTILKQRTKAEHLVIAGGVALNSVMNGRIVRESGFKDLYVMPAAGDNGTSIGAAYYIYNAILKNPRGEPHMNPYLGTEYSNEKIEIILKECKVRYEHYDNIELKTAELLHAGNILCWFQGKMEIGPRALGGRSIIADPTNKSMKDKINAEVKHREAYRPFAPSVIAEAAAEYFDLTVEDPFMLKVCNVKPDKMSVLPAITHVDGTARAQTVNKETHPRYHKMISEFGKLSGHPVVLNTSFNIMDEPIVESPYDAIRCFFSTGLDYLVIGNYVVAK
ncbi:MAG: carbamoyltransferase C-terminal domain-containing protein [Methylotenera sp.]